MNFKSHHFTTNQAAKRTPKSISPTKYGLALFLGFFFINEGIKGSSARSVNGTQNLLKGLKTRPKSKVSKEFKRTTIAKYH